MSPGLFVEGKCCKKPHFFCYHHTWCWLHVFPSTKSGLWHVIMHVSTDIFETMTLYVPLSGHMTHDDLKPACLNCHPLIFGRVWKGVLCCCDFLLGGCSVVASKIIPFTEKQLTLGTTWFNKICNYPVCWGVLPVVLLRFIIVDVKNQPDQPWEPIRKMSDRTGCSTFFSSSFWRKRSWITHPIKKGLLSISTQIHSTVMMHPLVN